MVNSYSGSVEPYKEESINRIESMSHTAAAIICSLSREVSFQETNNHFMGDVIGLVALLGAVGTSNLSRSVSPLIFFLLSSIKFICFPIFCFLSLSVCRILAEYLGKDQMLSIVCRSFAAAGALEDFVQSGHGEADSIHALYEETVLLKKSTHGRSFVICLEEIR